MAYYSWIKNTGRFRLASMLCALLVLTALPTRAQQGDASDELIGRGRAAGIDAALLTTVDQRAIENGLSPSQRSQLLSKGIELAEQGLPAAAVLHKTLEGLAKQVPVPMMVSVLDRMQQQTVEAGHVIDIWLQRPEARRLIVEVRSGEGHGRTVLVENLAEALVHDVPRQTIEAVLNRLQEQAQRTDYRAADVGTAIGVLADLPIARQDPEATADLLVSALNAGYSQAQMRRLPPAMKAAEQHGSSAAHTARVVAREMQGGTPADEVLRNLFRGEFPGDGVGMSGAERQGGPLSTAGSPPGVGPGDVGRNDARNNNSGGGKGQGN